MADGNAWKGRIERETPQEEASRRETARRNHAARAHLWVQFACAALASGAEVESHRAAECADKMLGEYDQRFGETEEKGGAE